MPAPKTEQTWDDTKKFWREGGAGKTAKAALMYAGDAMSGGAVGAAARQIENAPKRRERDAGLDDPTRVEYGGNVGSSTRDADGNVR